MSLRLFRDCRSEQEWTAGKSKGELGKTISYYLVCRAVALLSSGNRSILEKSGEILMFSIKNQL